MTKHDCTASSAVSENITYPTLLTNTTAHHVAEDTGEYNASSTDAAFGQALKRLDVKATGKALAGQITRLYGLVSLLLPDEQPKDRTGEELRQLAIELEQAVAIIEQTVDTLLAELTKDE